MRNPKILALLGLAILVPAAAWAATWTVMKSPNNGQFDNVLFGADALSTTSAWAVGRADFTVLPVRRPIILRFNNGRWRLVQSPSPAGGGELRDADNLSSTDAWAVGFSNTGGGFNTLTQRWNGASWSTIPSPNRPGAAENVLLAVKAFSANEAWAVGYNNVPNTLVFETLALEWDGVDWEIVPTPSPNPRGSNLLALDGTAPDDMWAVGFMAFEQEDLAAPLAMHWDGGSWTVTPIPFERDGRLEGVVALAPDDVWAAGWSFDLSLLWHVPYVIHWDGVSWTKVPTPQGSSQGGRLFDISALSPTQIYVVGHTNQSTIPSLVMRWNGSGWITEASPNPANVRWLWDATPFGTDDLLFVGQASKIINQNVGPARTLILRATD